MLIANKRTIGHARSLKVYYLIETFQKIPKQQNSKDRSLEHDRLSIKGYLNLKKTQLNTMDGVEPPAH